MAKLAINGGDKAAERLAAKIPVWPKATEEDKKVLLEVLESSLWSFPHTRVEQFEQAFAKYQDAKYGIAVANGTVSLELCLKAGGIEPGDEVIVPAITFISTVSTVTEVGAIPVFVDSDPDTISIDPKAIEKAITSRTKAVIAVHYGGYPVDFDAILPIVRKHNLLLIEDAAHAHGTKWKERKVGAIGDFGGFSFQQSKSLTAGEGGIVLTNNVKLAEKASLIRNIGRKAGVPGYLHLILSSNYRMTEFQAVLLLSQMKHLPEWTELKHKNGEYLARELRKIGGVEPLKRDPRITKRGYYFFIIRYNSDEFKGLPRDKFIEALNAEGVPCGTAYGVPLYKNPAFKKENLKGIWAKGIGPIPDYEKLYLPVAEEFCAHQQVALSHRVLMVDRSGIQMIIDSIAKIKDNVDELIKK
ncbi:aminotransferase DegT [Candidatus Aerophobetes bacterium Ae_b3a]|nr:MAG: aminotransferase DegT [Candidatus Aerophobetes bacterium Ae_b3a]